MSAAALETTDTDLTALRQAVDARRRKGTTTVAVDAEALRRLLNDHHTLWTVARRRALWQPGDDQESIR
jgi:hypothetical protein